MRIAFVVLGEGRGHMTQALALASHVRSAGHEVVCALVGSSPYRPVPAYFTDGIGCPVERFDAPTLVPGADRRRMSRLRTAADTARRMPRFVRSLRFIRSEVRRHAPDLVVNFYDLIAGLGRLLPGRDLPPQVVVGHHYLAGHPRCARLPSGLMGRIGFRILTRATALGATGRLALSFDALERRGGVLPIPPLLRPRTTELSVTAGDYLLAYALNPGYADALAVWQRRTPDTTVHCFVEGGASALSVEASTNFRVHELDGEQFLDRLAGCGAYVGTAGFEAVCEAFYLGKPTLAVPVDGHYEQRFNAVDAARAGVATTGTLDDLDRFWKRMEAPDPERVERFRRWVDSGPSMVVPELERVVAGGR